MVLSDCSASANSNLAVVSMPQSTLHEEKAKSCRALSHSNMSRQYTCKDENPPPMSPARSVNMDADDDSNSSLDDILGGEPQQTDDYEDEDGWDSDCPVFQKRTYDSPRLITEDHEIFPSPETHALYHENEQRWQQISEAAGSHRQDGSRLVIQRNINPVTLRCGIVSQFVGRRVRRMSVWLDDNEDILPQWLDAIVDLFPNLQELDLFQDAVSTVIEGEISASAQMRRLYILYRLPYLLRIDGEEVRPDERDLARPSTPSGARVLQNDWMHKDNVCQVSNLGRNDEETVSALDSLGIPANASIGSNTAMELGADIAQLTERIARLHDNGGKVPSDEPFLDDDDSLFGEGFVGQASPSIFLFACEERQDFGSTSRDQRETKHYLSAPLSPHSQSPIVADPEHPPPPPPGPPAQPTSQNHGRVTDLPTEQSKRVVERTPSRANKTIPTRGHAGLDDSYELVSVASSHHEWTAACGVLSFRTDRGCAPRLRLNFLGKNRKGNTDRKYAENIRRSPVNAMMGVCESPRDSLAPMQRLRLQKDRATSDTSTTLRRTRKEISATSCLTLLSSANQSVPPAKSLTSPFPMQFRERKSSLYVSTNAKVLSTNRTDGITLSAPRARGSVVIDTITKPMTLTAIGATPPVQTTKISDTKTASVAVTSDIRFSKNGFPPPCPGTVRRKVVASSLLQRDPLERKAARQRRMDRRMKVLHQNARSSSMMDGLDDDSTDSNEDIDGEHDVLDEDIDSLHQVNQW